jgi:hypothetical protein
MSISKKILNIGEGVTFLVIFEIDLLAILYDIYKLLNRGDAFGYGTTNLE